MRGRRLFLLMCLPALVMTWQARTAAGQGAARHGDESQGGIWKGVFTSAQADRGKIRFTAVCRRCHSDDLNGSERGPALRGDRFMANWEAQELSRLFAKARDTMPPDSPSSLPDEDYLDVVTYILQVNQFPAGHETLKPEKLDSILITKQDGEGSQEIPNFRLVRVVGCLTEGPDKNWVLTGTGEPVTAGDQPSSPAVLLDEAAQPLGSHTFRLVSVNPFDPAGHRGEKMEAKGLLYRAPSKDLINLVSLERVGTCGT